MNTRNLRFKSNRVRDILVLFHEELDDVYGTGEVRVFCEMLFEAFLGWDRVRLLISKEDSIDQSDLLRFHWALEDLKKYRPIQHIIGYTDFCGCRIEVSPDVLVPRPETEEMVEWIVKNKELRIKNVLDLCTGSGCIAIALKKAFPDAEVTGVDVSTAALEIARRNAKNNSTEINFVQANVLEQPFSLLTSHFSLLVSNPPYVMEKERSLMADNVLEYDPAVALFVPDNDPLRFYRAIAAIAKQHLASQGMLVVEINEALANETCALLRGQGFIPSIHTDFRGKQRWVSAVWNL
ncbi:MAG: peptide chain release factor N(5)-glutamine methyltransferase [bacterium]